MALLTPRLLVYTGSSISASGVAGGASIPDGNGDHGGGGGGGGGGIIFILTLLGGYKNYGTVQAPGGAGGTSGQGTAGTAGGVGSVNVFALVA